MDKKLPTIIFKGRKFFFDYEAKQLREMNNYSNTIKFIDLSSTETELLLYALKSGKLKLIKDSMEDLEFKL